LCSDINHCVHFTYESKYENEKVEKKYPTATVIASWYNLTLNNEGEIGWRVDHRLRYKNGTFQTGSESIDADEIKDPAVKKFHDDFLSSILAKSDLPDIYEFSSARNLG
jgi:hypothetical protein